jgi:hypothetical protein
MAGLGVAEPLQVAKWRWPKPPPLAELYMVMMVSTPLFGHLGVVKPPPMAMRVVWPLPNSQIRVSKPPMALGVVQPSPNFFFLLVVDLFVFSF